MNVGVLGAAFDPPHWGHILMALVVLEQKICDQVAFVPAPTRWDKETKTSDNIRLQWLKEWILYLNHPRISILDVELHQEFRGTYVLWKELSAKNIEHKYSLIMGQDSYEHAPQWRDPRSNTINGNQLLQEAKLIVFPRGGGNLNLAFPHHLALKSLSNYVQLAQKYGYNGQAKDLDEISSSGIKKAISAIKVGGESDEIQALINKLQPLILSGCMHQLKSF